MKHSPLRKLPPPPSFPPTCFSRLFHTVVGFVFHGLKSTDFLSLSCISIPEAISHFFKFPARAELNLFFLFFCFFFTFCRDPYVYSLFEITLSAIDSKLRRVDSLERNMEMMLAKLSENSARSDAILTQLKVMDGRLNRMSPPGSGSSTTTSTGGSAGTASSATSSDREYSLEPRILALDEKVSQIGSKLNVLTYQLDSNSLLWAGLANYNETGRAGSEDYVSSSSEQARAYISVPQIRGDKLIDRRGSDWNGNAEDTESIRTTMSSMDRHLKILIELFSEQMDKMISAVADVRTAVITSNPDPSSSLLLHGFPWSCQSSASSNVSFSPFSLIAFHLEHGSTAMR